MRSGRRCKAVNSDCNPSRITKIHRADKKQVVGGHQYVTLIPMSEFENWVSRLESGDSLSFAEASEAASQVGSDHISDQEKVRLLQALTRKGESAEEIAGFAQTFRNMALIQNGLPRQSEAIDVCGTGGDGSGTVNISTAVGFLLASLEVPVYKHGNRSVTSRCGSADILEAIGWPIQPSPEERYKQLDRFHFTFFFAPSFHPAFQHVSPVRKQLAEQGQRSIFNLLGPLLNPAQPPYQLIGVMDTGKVPLIADALTQLGIRRGLVAHSKLPESKGLDEASTVGENLLQGAGELRDVHFDQPLFGLKKGNFNELKGGDIQQNLAILEEFSRGKISGTLADTIALNAGLSLWIAEKADSPEQGIETAARQIKDGAIYRWLRAALT